MPRKGRGKGTKRAGGKKTNVKLTAELAEVLRWREMEWSRIPPLSRKLVMPYLTARDTINLDTAVTDKEDRKHLVKAYVSLRSAGLDGYAHYRVDGDGVCLGLQWAQKRSVDLRNFRLEYGGEKEDQNQVLALLVYDMKQELAAYFATRCDVRDTNFVLPSDPSFVPIKSSTLIEASERGYLEIVQALIGRGAEVNQKDSTGETPLMLALSSNRLDVARVLVIAGADLEENDANEMTPLQRFAQQSWHVDALRFLLEAGANTMVRDSEGLIPLDYACTSGSSEMVKALLEAGSPVNSICSHCEETPLFQAAFHGHIDVVRILISYEADVNKRNSHGMTPIVDAVTHYTWQTKETKLKKLEVAAILRAAGADEPLYRLRHEYMNM